MMIPKTGGIPPERKARAMTNMKKDFQKVVRMFRDDLPKETQYYSTGEIRKVAAPEYPKAMMTEQQIRKGTATINFGRGKQAQDNVEDFRHFEPFAIWCESYGIKTVTVEQVGNAYGSAQTQIRVTY